VEKVVNNHPAYSLEMK